MMMVRGSFLVLGVLLLTLRAAEAQENPDEVTSLPGVNFKVPFRHYSGYLDALKGNYLHYWFFESQNNSQTDPVVLWLSGGPGCSSMLAALTEQGPFRLVPNHSIELNPYAWNVRSSLLYIDSPAEVGFSYNANGNFTTGDNETAANNFAALKSFFRKYPHLKNNDFYITGESYAGIYVPTLSKLVFDNKFPKNFKGFAIGNGYLDRNLLGNSLLHFAYFHGIFDDILWNKLVTSCCDNVTNTRYCDFVNNQNRNTLCSAVMTEATTSIYNSHLNTYNIYAKCETSKKGWSLKSARDHIDRRLLSRTLKHTQDDEDRENVKGTPPCTNFDDLIVWTGKNSVRHALHIDAKAHSWTPCNMLVNLAYRHEYDSMKDIVRYLLQSGLKGLIYNGDVDSACNYLGDLWFAEELGFKTIRRYSPWMYEGQVGGFVKVFEKFAYTTIRGSGHMVPTDRPGPAQKMFYKFLDS